MRRWFKRIGMAVMVLLTICVAAAWWALQQTKKVPEFYAQATKNLPEDTAAENLRLQRDVRQLQEDAAHPGSWDAAFTDRQINAWLIQELPKKLPQLLAKGVSDPRIVIEEGRLLLAARYLHKRIDTVVSMEIHVELTEQPNMLAIKVKNLCAGALPIPLDRCLKGITREAAKGDIDIRWDLTNNGPVALVNVPSKHPKYVVNPVVVESVALTAGRLELAGHSGPVAEAAYQPRGPIHRFVSYRHKSKRKVQSPRVSSSRIGIKLQ